MAGKNVTIAGASYTAVPAVDLPVTGGGTARFTEVSDTTAAASDVAQGKYFYNASGQKTLGTASGGSSTDFVVTLSWDSQQEMWVPDYTYSRLAEEYDDGKTIVFVADDTDTTANGHFESGSHLFIYYVRWLDVDEYDNLFIVDDTYILSQNSGLELDDRLDYRYVNNEDRTVTPSESQQIVTFDPSEGYSGLGTVTVSAISSSYVGSSITRRSSSDLTASGATVTAPSGYYENNATKTVANGTVTAPATISGTSATVSAGTNTLTLSKTVSVTPNVTTSGYVSSGTAGNSAVSLTANVTTKGAATITPTTTNQTISSGTYLTGTQTIAGDADLVAGNIKKDVQIFGVTGTYEASGGGATVQTKETETLSSTVTSISFTGLSAQPKMWAVQNEVSNGSYFSGASTRYITSCLCSGGSTVYSLCMYKSGSTAREYGYTTCTWSYSNGTLTVTSPGTSTAGGFRTGSKYRLFCAY